MPSVGMRRTTRVFGARVLRSGRRLWTGPGEGKHMKTTNGEERIELLENSRDGGGDATLHKENGLHGNDIGPKQEVMVMDVDEKVVELVSEKLVHDRVVADNVGRRWGVVYTRKRKKVDSFVDFSVDCNKKRTLDDKKFGKQFFRKQWRKKYRQPELAEACDSDVSVGGSEKSFDNASSRSLMVVVDSPSGWYMVTCFLSSVLRYMRGARVGLRQLSAFLHSKTIAFVYSSCGIHFLLDSNLVRERGVCMIWGTSCFMPVFSVDYSSVPCCFMYLHSRMMLQFGHVTCSLGTYSVDIDEDGDTVTTSCMLSVRVQPSDVVVSSRIDYIDKTEMSPSNTGAAKLAGRNLQLRNGRNIQKRRSSLRSKSGRRPSSFGARKVKGALQSNLFSLRHNGIQLSTIAPRRELRSSAHRNTATNVKQVNSVKVKSTQNVDPTSCSANILVMDSDKCYRSGAAIITLEISAENQWHLAIKRDGINQYGLIAENFMRPCSCNRFTRAIIWGTDSGWKLEFPDRCDWLVFKELYKECSDRNAQFPAESFIPVPGIHQVSSYANSSSVFVRPASYISVRDDELSRALARSTANYDMDSDDEEWLNKLNSKFSVENDSHKLLSAENFELVIDSFERGFHCNPDDFSDEMTPPNISLNLERRVVEAVYSFWIKKRKQRRLPLVRIFQLYQPRRAQLIPNSVLRKKRSFKRQGSQIGRGKQRPFLQAMAAEQEDTQQQQNAVVKVEEAKAAANRSEGLAVLKRQRAQQLMENADLATYRATLAMKIAEMSPDAAVGLFFSVK